jgi:hypothetical protein
MSSRRSDEWCELLNDISQRDAVCWNEIIRVLEKNGIVYLERRYQARTVRWRSTTLEQPAYTKLYVLREHYWRGRDLCETVQSAGGGAAPSRFEKSHNSKIINCIVKSTNIS